MPEKNKRKQKFVRFTIMKTLYAPLRNLLLFLLLVTAISSSDWSSTREFTYPGDDFTGKALLDAAGSPLRKLKLKRTAAGISLHLPANALYMVLLGE
jgi:hypothetical protein